MGRLTSLLEAHNKQHMYTHTHTNLQNDAATKPTQIITSSSSESSGEMYVRIAPRASICSCSALFVTRGEFDGSRASHAFIICCTDPLWLCFM